MRRLQHEDRYYQYADIPNYASWLWANWIMQQKWWSSVGRPSGPGWGRKIKLKSPKKKWLWAPGPNVQDLEIYGVLLPNSEVFYNSPGHSVIAQRVGEMFCPSSSCAPAAAIPRLGIMFTVTYSMLNVDYCNVSCMGLPLKSTLCAAT